MKKNSKILKKWNLKNISSILLLILFLINISGCTQERDKVISQEQTAPVVPIKTIETPAPIIVPESPTPNETGQAKFDITFNPEVGRYQATASGTLKLTSPINNAKVEIYTKTNGIKKIVGYAKIGDLNKSSDGSNQIENISLEIILSKNRVTYKALDQGDSVVNGLTENQRHSLGIDFTSSNVKENWESDAFSFDYDDAYTTAPPQLQSSISS